MKIDKTFATGGIFFHPFVLELLSICQLPEKFSLKRRFQYVFYQNCFSCLENYIFNFISVPLMRTLIEVQGVL